MSHSGLKDKIWDLHSYLEEVKISGKVMFLMVAMLLCTLVPMTPILERYLKTDKVQKNA